MTTIRLRAPDLADRIELLDDILTNGVGDTSGHPPACRP
jgi:hypothetical protein